MSLKQSIVVRNEFTHNGVNTPGRGSRGGSPGQYVLRYMARVEASETITPVPDYPQASIFDYTTRYMLRQDATERLKMSGEPNVSVYELEHEFEELDRLSGRSFGNRGISLSDDTVRDSSERIQEAFDEGHSVQKVILSFTEDYLKDNGVLSPDYVHRGRGSYKGEIDQLKLRQAITNGVDKMTTVGNYANPEWVGVIQIDTNNVHAHLAIVDTEFSPSRMMSDGRDKGKLTQREMMQLRRGIQYELNEMKAIKGFHKQVSLERQNVVGYVKDYVNDHIEKNSRLQILMASLPEDQSMWRYGTNRKEMQYPNELAEQYVQEIFEQQPVRSGYREATRSIEHYIEGRVQTEDIDRAEQARLQRNGRNLIVERSVNGVYDSLKAFDKTLLTTWTPMLDIQSSSEDELLGNLSDGFDEVGFELRVRGYNNRRKHHAEESVRYKELVDNFEDAVDDDAVSSDAYMLHRFYQEELQWNMALTDKYRSFFRLNGRYDREMKERHTPEYEQLSNEYERLKVQDDFIELVDSGFDFEQLDGIADIDDIFINAKDVDYQLEELYGVRQGSRVFSSIYREGFEEELRQDKSNYVEDLRNYTFDCFVDGVMTQNEWVALQPDHRDVDGYTYELSVSDRSRYFNKPSEPKITEDGVTDEHFDAVKALDIHHLGIDYYTKMDRSIAKINRERFAESMQWREYFVNGAVNFLESTEQSSQVSALGPVRSDIQDMRRTVNEMSRDGLIPTIDEISRLDDMRRNKNTFSIDVGVDVLSSMESHLLMSEDDIEHGLIQDGADDMFINDELEY